MAKENGFGIERPLPPVIHACGAGHACGGPIAYNAMAMKPVRWTQHALENLTDREIAHAIADAVLGHAEFDIPDPPGRRILMGRYNDPILHHEMLLRIVVEDTPHERVVVTVYKTSQVQRYLKGLL